MEVDQLSPTLCVNGSVVQRLNLGADDFVTIRFYLIAVFGSLLSLFGVVANALLAALFLTRSHYRHSPFFFLGFVALFDTLLDATFILLLSIPVSAQRSHDYALYLVWLEYLPTLYTFAQIFKLASVLCLIAASVERFCMTRHWTFTGFESRTRWLTLFAGVSLAVLLKTFTTSVEISERVECSPFERWTISSRSENRRNWTWLNTATITGSFATLVFLNGGIVCMLRQQNVEQLRSLITELTMGADVMKLRRRNLRSATRTLLVILTAYLLANAPYLVLTLYETVEADRLKRDEPKLFRIASDVASVLTVLGNAIRCPAHFLSNSEIRQQFAQMCLGVEKPEKARVPLLPRPFMPQLRRPSERVGNPWISLLLKVHDDERPVSPLLQVNDFKRHNSIAIC